MFRKAYISQSKALKFRRWSRKNYAVFASLGKNILIGTLSVRINQSDVFKGANTVQLNGFQLNEETKEWDEPNEPISLTEIIDFLLLSTRQVTAPIGGNCICIKHKKNIFNRFGTLCTSAVFLCANF